MSTNDFLDALPDLAAFAAVAEAGSFSAAARQLGLTPSAVSRQVARLERRLKLRLMERTTRKLRLTEAGQAVLARSQDMLAAARGAFALGDELAGTPRGLVRVSVPKAVGRLVVHPLMAGFLRRYPEVDVQLVVTDRTVDLFAEPIDLAIRMTDSPPPGLAGRPLMAIRHMACASPTYLADRGMPLHPRELAQHSCLYLGEDERDRHWRFRRGADEVTVKVLGRYVANHSEIRLEGALAGFGIASLPAFTATPALQAGSLVQVLPDWEHLTAYAGTAWLLYPSNRYVAPKLRAFIDYLVASLGGGLQP